MTNTLYSFFKPTWSMILVIPGLFVVFYIVGLVAGFAGVGNPPTQFDSIFGHIFQIALFGYTLTNWHPFSGTLLQIVWVYLNACIARAIAKKYF